MSQVVEVVASFGRGGKKGTKGVPKYAEEGEEGEEEGDEANYGTGVGNRVEGRGGHCLRVRCYEGIMLGAKEGGEVYMKVMRRW